MQPSRRRLVRLTTIAGLGVAACALAVACSVQSDAPTSVAKPLTSKTSGYFEFRVTKQAAPVPGSWAVRYPDALRRANVEGRVLAQFVINADGTADMSTFKVLKSSDPQFTTAVKDGLAKMRFFPAEVDGHKVRQLQQMPFVFSLSK